MLVEFREKDPEALQKVAAELLNLSKGRRLFCLYGEMGAGKTTFVKAFCRELNVADEVASPTFSVINEYLCKDGSRVYHFDFYRIKRVDEALDLGIEDYFESGSFCFIEWPGIIEELLPADVIKVKMTIEGNERVIKSNL